MAEHAWARPGSSQKTRTEYKAPIVVDLVAAIGLPWAFRDSTNGVVQGWRHGGGCARPYVRFILLVCILTVLSAPEPRFALAQTPELDEVRGVSARIAQLYNERKYSEAIPLAEGLVAQLERLSGPQTLPLARSLSNLSALYLELGRFKEAEAPAVRALAITRNLRAPDHPDVRARLSDVSLIFYRQGRYAEAIPLLQLQLEIDEKVNPESGDVAADLGNLAQVFRRLGRLDEAERAYRRAVALAERIDPEGPDFAVLLDNFAGLYRERANYAEAELLYKRALTLKTKALGPEALEVGVTLNNLAWVYREQARLPDAEALMLKSLLIHERVRGPDHPDVATLLVNIAGIFHHTKRCWEALPLIQRALDIRLARLGPNHPDVATALQEVALIYMCLGEYPEAEAPLRRAVDIAVHALGPNHPNTAVMLGTLAANYVARRRPADAEPLLRRSLTILVELHGPDHPSVAKKLEDLGYFLKAEGRLDEAAPALQRAYDIFHKTLGLDHPDTISATLGLAELFGMQGRTTEALTLFDKAGSARSRDLQLFPIYFATNRLRDPAQKRIAFGIKEGDDLTLGVVKVVVAPLPGNAAVGTNTTRRITIQPTTLSTVASLAYAARQRLIATRSSLGQALVFIHGFNTSFDNATRRAAQLAFDLDFDGPVFVFSWPSQESVFSYDRDRELARKSRFLLKRFLETVVAETKAKRIHLVAHSMGNFALNEALAAMSDDALDVLNIGEIVMASPDLDPETFEGNYKRLRRRGTNGTIYASTSDRALVASTYWNGNARLGHIPAGGPSRIFSGIDLIDITGVNSDVFSLNHDLYANSPVIISDLRRLLMEGQRPPERRSQFMKPVTAKAGRYWRYEDASSRR